MQSPFGIKIVKLGDRLGFPRAHTREKHTAEPVQVRRTTYAFQICDQPPLPLLPADQARRTFNQATKELL